MVYNAKVVVTDIRTYSILSHNKNYADRLYEAYLHIKSLGLDTYEKFSTGKSGVGAFSYTEITIFDRLKNGEYKELLRTALRDINNQREEYINNPNIGDSLASWGTLGNTPNREQLITDGYITEGLTEEEKKKHYR